MLSQWLILMNYKKIVCCLFFFKLEIFYLTFFSLCPLLILFQVQGSGYSMQEVIKKYRSLRMRFQLLQAVEKSGKTVKQPPHFYEIFKKISTPSISIVSSALDFDLDSHVMGSTTDCKNEKKEMSKRKSAVKYHNDDATSFHLPITSPYCDIGRPHYSESVQSGPETVSDNNEYSDVNVHIIEESNERSMEFDGDFNSLEDNRSVNAGSVSAFIKLENGVAQLNCKF